VIARAISANLEVDRLDRVGERVATFEQHRGPGRRRRGSGDTRELHSVQNRPGRPLSTTRWSIFAELCASEKSFSPILAAAAGVPALTNIVP
jgi:hypothetical protein